MKRSPLIVTGSVFVAAWVSTGAVFAQSPEKINPDASGSVGGSRSERTGESNVPLPKGSPSSGTVEQGKSGSTNTGTSVEMSAGHKSRTNVKQAQQALKDKGHDPGPIDGVIGARTKEAIKSFQSASNIEATGTLDAETAQHLGISSSSGAMKSRGNMRSDGNTTRGKDSDQPNLPPQK